MEMTRSSDFIHWHAVHEFITQLIILILSFIENMERGILGIKTPVFLGINERYLKYEMMIIITINSYLCYRILYVMPNKNTFKHHF